jgi:hypothetical protein
LACIGHVRFARPASRFSLSACAHTATERFVVGKCLTVRANAAQSSDHSSFQPIAPGIVAAGIACATLPDK